MYNIQIRWKRQLDNHIILIIIFSKFVFSVCWWLRFIININVTWKTRGQMQSFERGKGLIILSIQGKTTVIVLSGFKFYLVKVLFSWIINHRWKWIINTISVWILSHLSQDTFSNGLRRSSCVEKFTFLTSFKQRGLLLLFWCEASLVRQI